MNNKFKKFKNRTINIRKKLKKLNLKLLLCSNNNNKFNCSFNLISNNMKLNSKN